MRTTHLQFVQLITGILIAILLAIHMINMHLDAILGFFGVQTILGVNIAQDPTIFNLMIARAQKTVFAGIYIALLVFTLYHAFYGLRNVILELSPSQGTERIITGIIIIIGIIFLGLGVYAPIALLS